MNYPISTNTEHIISLAFADGSIWDIVAVDDRAHDVVLALAKAMQLHTLDKSDQNKSYQIYRRLIVRVEDRNRDSVQLSSTNHWKFEDENTIVCILISEENNEIHALPLVYLSMLICRDAQHRRGVLLHGALAGWDGNGVILAGPGGRGKTTASRRLPHRWQSFCDDTTLVVCDDKGAYWAHPWPTWSTFMFNGPGGTWNVQNAVPLKGIFFLDLGQKERIEPLGGGQATCLLNESSEQASSAMSRFMEKRELRKLRQLRFDSICSLVKAVPSYVLRLSRNGAFWTEIERILNE